MTGAFPRVHLSSTGVYNDFSLRYLSLFSSCSAFILMQTEAWQERRGDVKEILPKRGIWISPFPSLKDIFNKMQGFAMHKYISSAKANRKGCDICWSSTKLTQVVYIGTEEFGGWLFALKSMHFTVCPLCSPANSPPSTVQQKIICFIIALNQKVKIQNSWYSFDFCKS